MSSLILETNRKSAKEAEETTMEEELEKRNTDCVYFLASPLTCRKGAECEYRHSEIARLNPRDCWYWMSGSCLNPTCAFRHPPLEKPSESASESDSLQNQTAASTNKTDVPCYFYFNGFCNKGDKCSFSHGPDMFTLKSVKPSSAVAGVLPGKKTSVGNEAVPTLKKAHINPPEVASKIAVDLKPNHVVDSHQTVPRRIIQDRSPQVIVPQHENESVVNSSSVFLEGDLVPRETYTPSYQNSEDQVDEYVEVEERLESSPENFDVLVDDKSEYLAYEDDEYLQAIKRERRELNSHFMGDDFADRTEYDPAYPDPEHFFEGEMVGSYDHVDNIHMYNDVGNDSRDRMLNSEPSRKRKIHSSEVAINGQRGQDLRDHLRKRKTGNGYGYGADRLGRNGDSYRRTNQNEERHRHGISQRLRGRLVLDAGKAGAESLGNNGTFSDGGIQRGWIHDTPPNMSRQGFVDRRPANRQFLPSERQRRSGSGDRRSSEERVAFSGPKTLAQLREEKKKAGENGDCIGIMGQSSHMESADFEGPKPLSAILKDKRRPSSVVAGNGS